MTIVSFEFTVTYSDRFNVDETTNKRTTPITDRCRVVLTDDGDLVYEQLTYDATRKQQWREAIVATRTKVIACVMRHLLESPAEVIQPGQSLRTFDMGEFTL